MPSFPIYMQQDANDTGAKEDPTAFLKESDVAKIKTTFWAFNITDFAPQLNIYADVSTSSNSVAANKKAGSDTQSSGDASEQSGAYRRHMVQQDVEPAYRGIDGNRCEGHEVVVENRRHLAQGFQSAGDGGQGSGDIDEPQNR
jgi:hypothetical protein